MHVLFDNCCKDCGDVKQLRTCLKESNKMPATETGTSDIIS